MKRMQMWVCLVFLLTLPVLAEKIADLPDLVRVNDFALSRDRLYVVAGTSVHIYSRKDYHRLGSFGREGEGPGEFKLFAQIHLLDQELLFHSVRRFSFFSLEGTFLREHKTVEGHGFIPLGQGYAGLADRGDAGGRCLTVHLFDARLAKGEELLAGSPLPDGKINWFCTGPELKVMDGRLYASTLEQPTVKVFDAQGKLCGQVSFPARSVPLTQAHQQKFMDTLKKGMDKEGIAFFRQMMFIPEYLPVIREFDARDGVLYILANTDRVLEGVYEVLMLDPSGNLLKRVTMRLGLSENGFKPFPLFFTEKKCFQLIENEDTEIWELHATTI